jgi:hypothetical protein
VVTTQRADLRRHGRTAARIIHQAWFAPTMYARQDYLDWFFGFPSSLLGVAVVASQGQEPVGFGALLPRRVRLGGQEPEELYVLSLLAVLPTCRGQGVALTIMHELIGAAADARRPFVVFTLEQSPGEAILHKACEEHGVSLRPLGRSPMYAFQPPRSPERPPVRPRFAAEPADLLPLARGLANGNILGDEPDEAALAHWGTCPDPYHVLLLRGPAGTLEGGAILVRFRQQNQATAAKEAAILEKVFLPRPTLAVLQALRQASCQEWPDGRRSEAVFSANLGHVEPQLLQAAGFRRGLGVYHAYIASADPRSPFLAAQGTTLSVA